VEPERILRQRWLETLEFDVLTKCVTEFQRYYPFDVKGLYTDEFYEALMDRRLDAEFPVFKSILDENESGLTGHGVPVLMVQGAEDMIITTEGQREYVQRLRATGVDVALLVLDRVRHRYTRPAGFVQSVEFMRGLTRR
jgi:acetyl esterase/lipase